MVILAAILCFGIAFACASYVVGDILLEIGGERALALSTASAEIEERAARQAYEEAQRALAEAQETVRRASARLIPISRRRASVGQRAALCTVGLGVSA
jgi:hypothetical protein